MNTMEQRRFFFSLRISRQEFLKYYEGTADSVLVISECGRRLSFPALRLRPFLTQQGVQGRFSLIVDGNNRLIRLEQIPPRR